MVITQLYPKGMSSKYQIAETKTFLKLKMTINKKLYAKIENFVYPQLRENPLFSLLHSLIILILTVSK